MYSWTQLNLFKWVFYPTNCILENRPFSQSLHSQIPGILHSRTLLSVHKIKGWSIPVFFLPILSISSFPWSEIRKIRLCVVFFFLFPLHTCSKTSYVPSYTKFNPFCLENKAIRETIQILSWLCALWYTEQPIYNFPA